MASAPLLRRGGKLFDATSIAATVTSDVMERLGALIVSIHFVSASAARGGTLTIEQSNNNSDYVAVKFRDKNDDLQSSLTITASSAFNEFAIVDLPARFLRVVFTDVSTGAGTLDAIADSVAREN